MTLSEYYDKLRSHDWYYTYSDDHRVYTRGQAEYESLRSVAKSSAEHQALFDAWYNYMFTGKPWGNERAPYPELPQ